MDFFKKYQLLRQSIPVPALSTGNNSENCEYCDYTYWSKDCIYCFDCFHLEDALYCTKCLGKYLVDCDYCLESELCYQAMESDKCYKCFYIANCHNCQECLFCSMCIGCSDCFGCVGLTHKKYCIFNKQYSEGGYRKKVVDLLKKNYLDNFNTMLKLKQKITHPQNNQISNVNCPYGDYIRTSKDSYWCFDTYQLENCGYIYDGGSVKNCWDAYFVGRNAQLCYQMIDSADCYHCAFMENSSGCRDCYYCYKSDFCSDCFGCVALTHKKYCILNNQLTKELYEKTVAEIKKELGWKISS